MLASPLFCLLVDLALKRGGAFDQRPKPDHIRRVVVGVQPVGVDREDALDREERAELN